MSASVEVEVGLASPDSGPRVVAPFGRRLCEVQSNQAVGAYRLLGASDPEGPPPLPGQFYMLATADGWGGGQAERPYLARAFSVCRVRPENRGSRLDFLVEEIGPGTRRLAAVSPGEGLWLLGPLGVGFSPSSELSPHGEEAGAILVGGGAGIAPLVIWAEALVAAGTGTHTLLGFRSDAYCDAARLVPGDVRLATDDGSTGHRGLVTDLLEAELDRSASRAVYACGPAPMLESVRRICAERGVAAELALEEAMACGFGACFGCVVKTTSGYRRICVDGPVVAAAELDETWLQA